MYNLELIIPGLPKTQNQQLRRGAFWNNQNEKKKWERIIHLLTLTNKPMYPLKKAQIELTRMSAQAPDYDGLVASFKPVVDALVKCRILDDDSMEHLPNPSYLWTKAPAKFGKIKIVLKELPCHPDTTSGV